MRKAVAAAIFASVLAPAAVQAQACIGVPAGQGQFALLGEIGFADEAKSYGVTGTANLTGPLSLSVGVAQIRPDEGDETAMQYGAQVAYEVQATPRISACPLVGASYGTFSTQLLDEEIEVSALLVPVGVGLGTTFATSAADLTVFAVPAFLWARNTIEGSFLGEEVSDTETDSAFGLTGGVRASRGALFGGASFALDSFEGSETTFSVGVGILVGGR